MDTTIAFIGAGEMAEAIISGIQPSEQFTNALTVINYSDKVKLNRLQHLYNVNATTDYEEAVRGKDIIVLAVKPKNLHDAILSIRPFLTKGQLIVSVAAGITLATIEQLLPKETVVIRAMPNTSAKVHASATAISIGTFATEKEVKLAINLFTSIGSVSVVNDDQMDAVTAIAGSGPAYFYYLAETMINSAIEKGLSAEEAKAFVAQTMLGSATRLSVSEKPANELYQEIMSPGGTTEAAISYLNETNSNLRFKEAIDHAYNRSTAIGQAFSPSKK
ncbi:pyrroline-5-carboxylate reductase [Bacillus sp. JCM 19041]|uniref:pyrroline-5-carboxylate reductase n=1 Tax=Bacillus sp. JCM 19041 TaxID=1460637 RepID=UPI000A45C4DD